MVSAWARAFPASLDGDPVGVRGTGEFEHENVGEGANSIATGVDVNIALVYPGSVCAPGPGTSTSDFLVIKEEGNRANQLFPSKGVGVEEV